MIHLIILVGGYIVSVAGEVIFCNFLRAHFRIEEYKQLALASWSVRYRVITSQLLSPLPPSLAELLQLYNVLPDTPPPQGCVGGMVTQSPYTYSSIPIPFIGMNIILVNLFIVHD